MRRPGDSPRWRADRWLTLHAARPLGRVAQLALRPPPPSIPILMYHGIDDDVDDEVHPYFRTVTTRATFARQMAQLAARGIHAVTLSEATRLLSDPDLDVAQARRTVVITFDDGFGDIHAHAWPVLQRHGFAATVFLATGFVGKPFVTGRACLQAAQVRELAGQGLEFGSHTVSHPRLVELPEDALRRELVDSRRDVEDLTGRAVSLFSYPYRFPQEDVEFVRRFGALMLEAGYLSGVTTIVGRAQPRDDLRFLPRLPVNDADDAALLDAKLDGHYDWMRPLQSGRKQIRAWLRGKA
jgi:peptidoglycan/xylan/chitin deacetylase (PgdA/CDA1 family)